MYSILSAIKNLDKVENEGRSILDDDGAAALIELSDRRREIERLVLADIGPKWHLFEVTDGAQRMLISAHSGSQTKAEELVLAAAIDEHEFDPEFIGAEFICLCDRDVCLA